MKRLISALIVVLMLFAFAGCDVKGKPENEKPIDTSAPAQTTVNETQNQKAEKSEIPFKAQELYAVAHIGYQNRDNLKKYEKYVDTKKLSEQKISDGDVYLIIPRYPDSKIKLYKVDMNTEERSLVLESEKGEAFILSCNVSDIIPDAVIEISHNGEKTEFSPFVSLKDGKLDIGERGLDITEK